MRITIWGCRGSVPAPGPETLRYGGNTTCLEIRATDNALFIVDAGSGLRKLGKKLLDEAELKEFCLILTHSHWDHLLGFPFFLPGYFSRFSIHVCGGPGARDSLRDYLARPMEPPYFPVDFGTMKANFTFCQDCPGDRCHPTMRMAPVPLSHPNGGYGYRFVENGRTFVFLTDNEIGFPHPGGLSRTDYVAACRGADLLIHDAQYTDEDYKITRGWGHSTFAATVDLALEAGVKRLGLFHHDPDRTDEDLERQLAWCRQRIAAAGAKIDCFACAEGQTLELS